MKTFHRCCIADKFSSRIKYNIIILYTLHNIHTSAMEILYITWSHGLNLGGSDGCWNKGTSLKRMGGTNTFQRRGVCLCVCFMCMEL